jgi:hypothetical protein
MTKALNISLTKSQADFLQLDCYFPAFIAGLGSGKSHTMGLCANLDAQKGAECLVGVYEPTYDLTRTVAIPAVKMWLDEFGTRYKENKNEHVIYTSTSGVGDFMFKSLDNLNLLVGYETFSAHVDELDKLDMDRAREAWGAILSRNRLNPVNLPRQYQEWSDKNQRWEAINKVSAYSSPEGFKFCYEMWGRNKDSNGNWINPAYQYVQGCTRDNPALTEAYIRERTKTMSDEQVRAYINGEFVNLSAGTVYSSYNRKVHRSTEDIIDKEPLYIGIDFNVENMSACVFVRRNGGKEWHCVRELSGLKNTFALIEAIKYNWQSKGHKIIVYPDASGKNERDNATMSSIALLSQAGFEVRARGKNIFVADRVESVQKGFREMRIFIRDDICSETARCIEQQAYGKDGKPDKKSGLDHLPDAFGYAISYEMPVRSSLIPVDFSFMMKGAF